MLNSAHYLKGVIGHLAKGGEGSDNCISNIHPKKHSTQKTWHTKNIPHKKHSTFDHLSDGSYDVSQRIDEVSTGAYAGPSEAEVYIPGYEPNAYASPKPGKVYIPGYVLPNTYASPKPGKVYIPGYVLPNTYASLRYSSSVTAVTNI
jgi:hypothetical protein